MWLLVPIHSLPDAFLTIFIALPNTCTWLLRQEKFTNGDAPKVIKWWLLDVHGHEHLAVVGEEKENKDGHYAYLRCRCNCRLLIDASANCSGAVANDVDWGRCQWQLA